VPRLTVYVTVKNWCITTLVLSWNQKTSRWSPHYFIFTAEVMDRYESRGPCRGGYANTEQASQDISYRHACVTSILIFRPTGAIRIPSARCGCARWLALFLDNQLCVRTANIIIANASIWGTIISHHCVQRECCLLWQNSRSHPSNVCYDDEIADLMLELTYR